MSRDDVMTAGAGHPGAGTQPADPPVSRGGLTLVQSVRVTSRRSRRCPVRTEYSSSVAICTKRKMLLNKLDIIYLYQIFLLRGTFRDCP